MGWWTEDPFKKKPTPKQGKSKSWWTSPLGSSTQSGPKAYSRSQLDSFARRDKCPICGKRWSRCGHTYQRYQPVKEKVTRERPDKLRKDGKPRKETVTRNAGYSQDDRGIYWCDTCRCRVMNGRCTNITCSTRR